MRVDIWSSQREQATILPDSGLKVLVKTIPHKDNKHLMIWKPKALKPSINLSVGPAQVEDLVREAEDRFLSHTQEVSERRQKRKGNPELHELVKLGSIFVTSWGYEQTNIEFFQVIERKETMVVIRPIKQQQGEATSWCSAKTIALPNEFFGEPMKKRLAFDCGKPSISIYSFASAYLWDGKERHCSWGH